MIIFRKYWKDNQSHEIVTVGKTEQQSFMHATLSSQKKGKIQNLTNRKEERDIEMSATIVN